MMIHALSIILSFCTLLQPHGDYDGIKDTMVYYKHSVRTFCKTQLDEVL